jgi:methionyl aminopeptidase
VPDHIKKPPYADTGHVERRSESAVKSPDVIERMRKAGAIAAEVLRLAGAMVRPGITTDEIDVYVHQLCIERGAYPSPLNYQGYPKSVCTSVNEVICHGIPDSRVLQDGDIINLDVTCYVDGVHGDTNATFAVGTIDEESRHLIEVTRESMWRGINVVRPGVPLYEIGRAIESHAKSHKMGVVRAFIGHGIGEQFHTDIQILHYYEPRNSLLMRPGMTFTIEPMITLGSEKHRMWDDDWTAVTIDGRRTAQFEHTVLVTDDGVEVLTK